MCAQAIGRGWRSLALVMSGLAAMASPCSIARAQDPLAPTSREAPLEERLRKLEAMNQKLAERYEAMERKHAEEYHALSKKYDALHQQVTAPGAAEGEARSGKLTSRQGGAGARDNPAISTTGKGPKKGPTRLPLKANFGPGFELMTEDEEFQIQVHNMTQVDSRIYQQTRQDPVHNGFTIPRQRWYFTGRLTKPIEYYTSINRGYGTGFELLDAYINFHYDDRFMLKFGRYKTPYTYEYYAQSVQDLIAPERSLYSVNFALNRQLGLMGCGQLFAKRLDYAVGIFNGPRNSFEDTNDAKDVIAYLNARPFETSEGLAFLKFLNVGGSVDAGYQNNPLLPQALRTSVNASNSAGAAAAAPAFLTFNKDVIEGGERTLWDLHMAYFYKGLSLLAEWDSGFTNYARTGSGTRTHLPISGYFVQAAYFLTGETVERRTQVRPLHPFDLRKNRFGLGAFEVHARFSEIDIGKQVFTSGLADPNLWTNRAYAIDAGLNWYLNEYVKIYLDWQHAEFGQQVLYRPGRLQSTSDLFWLRAQLYF